MLLVSGEEIQLYTCKKWLEKNFFFTFSQSKRNAFFLFWKESWKKYDFCDKESGSKKLQKLSEK